MQKKRLNATSERLLFGLVTVLGVGFLLVATFTLVRSLQTSPRPVAERVTEQAETIQQTAEAIANATLAAGPEAGGGLPIQPTETPFTGSGVNPGDLPAPAASDTPGPSPTGLIAPTQGEVTQAAASTLVVATSGPTNTPGPTSTAGPATNTPAPIATSRPATGPSGGLPPAPGPSPTWVLQYMPTPSPASGPSKLGFHVTLGSGGILEFTEAVQPAVVKGVEDFGLLREVKLRSPSTVTIGRYIVDEWQTQVGVGDPVQQAIDFVQSQLPRYAQHHEYVDYWEGYNEVTPNPHIAWYAQFEATRACEMQKYGYRAAIGGFSTGTPEPFEFELFIPAIEAGIRCGAILHLHEYGAPTLYMWWGQGIPSVPGQPHYPDRGPLKGRYRWFYNDYLIPQGLVIPLVISEAGVDGLVAMAERPESNYTGPGWLNFRDFWVQSGLTNDPTRFYVDQLIWYDSLLRQDSYVIGATIYTIAGGCCPQQATYESADIIPLLTEYMLSLRP